MTVIKINDPNRIREMKDVYDDIVNNINRDAKVFIKFNEPDEDMACIHIVSNEINIPYGKYLEKMFEASDLVEFYKTDDGNVEMCIVFNNTVREV